MLLTDARNCGACGRACGRGQACNGAACRYEPPGPMTTARHGFGFAVGADGAVYAIGGYVARDLITPAVESYNVDTRRWTPRAPLPLARGGLAAATLRDGRVLAIGGTIGPAPTSTAAAYTPASDSWSAIASMANPRSYPAIARGIDGRVYVFGGVTNALLMRATDLGEVYDPASNSWAALRPMPRERSNATAVTASDGRIYVFGGLAAGGSIESIDVYDPTTNTWTSGPSHRFTGAYGTVRGSDGRIYQVLADLCVALSLPSTYTNIAPLHARRSEFGLVAFEDALMVFGGYGSTELATAEVYSIALNTWQPSPP